MTSHVGTSFAQNVKTLRMERPDRLVATVFHVARGCFRHPQRDKAGERERPRHHAHSAPKRTTRASAAAVPAMPRASTGSGANSDSTNATATSASTPYS